MAAPPPSRHECIVGLEQQKLRFAVVLVIDGGWRFGAVPGYREMVRDGRFQDRVSAALREWLAAVEACK
jgi:hypothetical protein